MDLYRSLPLQIDLPSIRLIELELDGDKSSKIILKLNTYTISSKPDYDAVSYHWGDQSNFVDISINDHNYPVTKNLHEALQQFRSSQRSDKMVKRKLWIDAICIHQVDTAEKASQLLLMKDIFAGANHVLVWLGKSDSSTEIVFDTLERFAAAEIAQHENNICHYTNISSMDEYRRTAIQRFITRPYFDRVWIVQEVTVAKEATIHCGPFFTDFEKLIRACQRMTGSGFFPFAISGIGKLTSLGDWRRAFHEIDTCRREDAFDMNLFVDFRDKHSTDLRDKVYSLRGLSNSIIRKGILVDYDHSVERIYTDFAKHLLDAQSGLRVLSAVTLRHRRTSHLRLPSWVADWSQPQLGGGILQKYYRFMPSAFFKAGGTGQPRRLKELENPSTICLEGFVLGIVKDVIPIKCLLVEDEFRLTEASLRQMAAGTALPELYSFTGEALWKAVFRTLTADRSILSTRIRESYRTQYLSRFHDVIPSGSDVNWLNKLPEAAWAEIAKTLAIIIEDKVMFTTSKGHLGLGQEGFQAGNVVCIFAGAETPFMLSAVASSRDKRFELLSECYIHGIMDGESIDSGKCQHFDIFVLQ